MRIALAQLNPTVGDLDGNARQVVEAVAAADGADLVVCGEMNLLGYPPRDLLMRDGVAEACERALDGLARETVGTAVLVGLPRREPAGVRPLRNSAALLRDGRVELLYDKQLLPSYDVFDEDRYFEPGDRSGVFEVAGRRVGILICEDLWKAGDVITERHYERAPARDAVEAGADVLVSLNATPVVRGKRARHLDQVRAVARELDRPLVMVNQVGANDDVIFDGGSVAVNATGAVIAALPRFEEAVAVVDIDDATPIGLPVESDEAEVFGALRLGVRDYCRKTGHDRVVLGLSGGIDSAVTAAIAAAALGPQRVIGVLMPSRYSSPGSLTDARTLAEALGLPEAPVVPIESGHDAMAGLLAPVLGAEAEGITDENIQSRLRGIIVMAFANARGALALATGNKSELAVGYCTLYGDMAGALAVIGDLTKTRTYALAEWINANHAACGFASPPIPRASIDKVPSAELRPDQSDQDTLPPYDVLDAIVEGWVEQEHDVDRIAREAGLDRDLVERWAKVIDRNEHKRNQSALVLKVTGRAFGPGRRMPIVLG